MSSYIKEKSKFFYNELLTSKLFVIILCLYVLIKIISNIILGASYFTAVRSGVMGVLMYFLGYYIVNLFSENNNEIENKFQIEKKVAKKGFIISTIYFAFLFTVIIDSLQRKNIVFGKPLLSYIPGYDLFIATMNNLSNSIAGVADFIEPYQIYNIITGNILYVIIPLILFMLLGYNFKGLFSLKNSRASWPFVGFYAIAFAINGFSITRIWGLIYSILYPGLCEEFFHRGIVFQTASSFLNKIGTSLIVGTIFFSLIHFPDFYFRINNGNLLITFSTMANVFMYGLLMAYGFRKTGTLLPWIIIHALSDTFYL